MSQRYKKTPAELLGIFDPYTAFCLNEACHIVACKIDDKEEPIFETHYNSFSEMYRQILNQGG